MTPKRLIVLLALLAPPALAQPFDSLALAQGGQLSVTPSTQSTQGTPGTRVLRGQVVTSSDVPLPRVRVAVFPGSLTEPAVFTDERGQFTVRLPDAESVRVTFTKARYVDTSIDVRRSAATPQDGVDVRVRLSLGGAISGEVRDRTGAPVAEATVTARRLSRAPTSDPAVFTATTDDLGDYRIGSLAPGAYAVGAHLPGFTAPSGPAAGTAPVEEQTVNVGLGAEVSGLDVTIDVPSELSVRVQRPTTDPDATASLRGRVLSPRGAPVAGAVVQAYRSGMPTNAVESDARGRYVIEGLVPGDYTVQAFKRGYIMPRPGQGLNLIDALLRDRSSDPVVSVGRGQTVDAIDLTLARGGSIAGTIVDEFGEPMRDVGVAVVELRVVAGTTRALRSAAGRGSSGRTDDRGRYRVFGLQPGTYIVQATAGNMLSSTSGYVPTFYPGTTTIDLATPTKLDLDASVAGVDLALLPQPTRRVRGIVLTPAGTPAAPAQLTLSRRSGAIQMEAVRTITGADGTFAFNNVAPGDYVVQAMTTDRTGPSANVAVARQFAEAFVTVAGDEPPQLQLQLSLGATLMGRVVFEGIPSPPAYTGVALTTTPVAFDDVLWGASSIGFVLLSDHTFEYRGIFGRSLLVAQPKDPAWYVKSITYRGQDLADTPFDFGSTDVFRDIEVVVSAAGAVVTGRVTDDRAAPVRDYTVAVVPADRSKWTIRSRWLKTARAMHDGSFRVTGLVPGNYFVVALDKLNGTEVAGDLQNPEFLDSLAPRAVRITLGEAQSQDLTLRLVRR